MWGLMFGSFNGGPLNGPLFAPVDDVYPARPWQRGWLRLTIAACATAIGAVAVVLGAPIGVVLGRAAWKAITDRVPLGFVGPTWILIVAPVAPAVVLVVNALACCRDTERLVQRPPATCAPSDRSVLDQFSVSPRRW